jgi:hypothetical protein
MRRAVPLASKMGECSRVAAAACQPQHQHLPPWVAHAPARSGGRGSACARAGAAHRARARARAAAAFVRRVRARAARPQTLRGRSRPQQIAEPVPGDAGGRSGARVARGQRQEHPLALPPVVRAHDRVRRSPHPCAHARCPFRRRVRLFVPVCCVCVCVCCVSHSCTHARTRPTLLRGAVPLSTVRGSRARRCKHSRMRRIHVSARSLPVPAAGIVHALGEGSPCVVCSRARAFVACVVLHACVARVARVPSGVVDHGPSWAGMVQR